LPFSMMMCSGNACAVFIALINSPLENEAGRLLASPVA
jgi:hypothetical protein